MRKTTSLRLPWGSYLFMSRELLQTRREGGREERRRVLLSTLDGLRDPVSGCIADVGAQCDVCTTFESRVIGGSGDSSTAGQFIAVLTLLGKVMPHRRLMLITDVPKFRVHAFLFWLVGCEELILPRFLLKSMHLRRLQLLKLSAGNKFREQWQWY